jgi:deoxyribose-phosphate aldolase
VCKSEYNYSAYRHMPAHRAHYAESQVAASEPLAIATLGGHPLLPNHGIPLDLNWIQEVRVNTSAVERRTQSQVARRTVKKDWQAAWLLRAITCMDLTTLSGDDTDERVRRLCAKARYPAGNR